MRAGAALQDRLERLRGDGLQPPDVLAAQGARGETGLYIADQQEQHLHEGQVGIAHPGVGVAATAGDNQVGVRLHGPLRELAHEHGLAAARLPHHETDAPLAAQRLLQPAIQLGELLLAGDEEGTR